MQGINQVVISGNLTRDPEMRTTAQGTSIISFSVAVNDRVKGENGYTDYPNYFDVTVFNGVDYLARNLSKGSHVVVAGKLRWSKWEAKGGGGIRTKVEIIGAHVEIEPKYGNAAPAPDVDYSEDIPF